MTEYVPVRDFCWISYDVGKGGSGRYRCEQPAKLLAGNGLSTHVGGMVGSMPNGLLYTVTEDEKPVLGKVIILQRHAADTGRDKIRAARKAGQQVWIDVDDLMPAVPPSNIAASDPAGIQWWCDMATAADGLICSTPELAQGMAKYNRRRVVLGNLIDLDDGPRWSVNPEPAGPLRQIGWVGNTPVHRDNLAQLRGWLPELLEHDPSLMVYWGGWHPDIEAMTSFGEFVGLPPERVTVSRAKMIDVYPELFRGIDLGLVPLAGSRFSQAKTATKGMEYAAAGVPFLWSDHPSYRRTFGLAGRCRNPRDWAENVTRLRAPNARAALLAAQRESATQTVAVARERWTRWAASLNKRKVAA